MQKKDKKYYQKQVADYYGKNTSNKKKATVLVITKTYDDGTSLNYSHGQEYDIVGKESAFGREYNITPSEFSEYEIISENTQVGISTEKSMDFESGYYVEQFEEVYYPLPTQKEEPCECKDKDKGWQKPKPEDIIKEPPVEQKPIPLTQSYSKNGNGYSKSESKSEDSEDDDFMADIKSILRGNKTYNSSNKSVEPLAVKSQQQEIRPRQEEQEIKPLDQKSEHAIFDKIAQSMKFANAYDLGSISLENRFNDFDKIEELSKTPKNKAKEETKQSSAISEQQSQTSYTDFIQDLDLIKKEQDSVSETFTKEIPLDPGVGGRSILPSMLMPGDIILSTTTDFESGIIRKVTGSEISHCSVYIGDGKVIEAVADGVLERSLETSLADDSLAVAYHHANMTPEKAARVVEYLVALRKLGKKFDHYGLIRVLPYQIATNYCNSLPTALQKACKVVANGFKTGTDNNNEFYCSELVLEALKDAGLSITDSDPSWSSAQDLVRLNHNGSLLYVGHLKV